MDVLFKHVIIALHEMFPDFTPEQNIRMHNTLLALFKEVIA